MTRNDVLTTEHAKARNAVFGGSTFSVITGLFFLKGTVLSRTMPQVACVSLAAVAAKLTHTYYPYTLNPMVVQLVGGMLAFFIVFRTNLAYDRYYEGKKLLGTFFIVFRTNLHTKRSMSPR